VRTGNRTPWDAATDRGGRAEIAWNSNSRVRLPDANCASIKFAIPNISNRPAVIHEEQDGYASTAMRASGNVADFAMMLAIMPLQSTGGAQQAKPRF
jgi:hypothetical protein